MNDRDADKGILDRRPFLSIFVALLVGLGSAFIIVGHSSSGSSTTPLFQPPPTTAKDRQMIQALVTLAPGEEITRIWGRITVRASTTNRVAGYGTVARFEQAGQNWHLTALRFRAPGLPQSVYIDGGLAKEDIHSIVTLVQATTFGPPDRISMVDNGLVEVETAWQWHLRLVRVEGVWTIADARMRGDFRR